MKRFLVENVINILAVIVIILCAIVVIATSINDAIFRGDCYTHHGHIEIYENGQTSCKYPLSIP